MRNAIAELGTVDSRGVAGRGTLHHGAPGPKPLPRRLRKFLPTHRLRPGRSAGPTRMVCAQSVEMFPLAMDPPLVIQIVHVEEKIDAFLPVLDEMMGSGLVTLEQVRVVEYRAEATARTNASPDSSC